MTPVSSAQIGSLLTKHFQDGGVTGPQGRQRLGIRDGFDLLSHGGAPVHGIWVRAERLARWGLLSVQQESWDGAIKVRSQPQSVVDLTESA